MTAKTSARRADVAALHQEAVAGGEIDEPHLGGTEREAQAVVARRTGQLGDARLVQAVITRGTPT